MSHAHVPLDLNKLGAHARAQRRRPTCLRINSWPLFIVSLVAVVRGLTYLGTQRTDRTPAGLDALASVPILFAFFCLLWMLAGVLGIVSVFTGERRNAIALIVGLTVVWALSYLAQFVVDVFTHDIKPPPVYLGGLTYLGFGAAVFHYPSKG